MWSAGVSTRFSLRHRALWRRGGGSAEGWGCGRGPSAFFEGGTMPPERPGSQPSPIPAARSCELPDRAKGGGDVPVRRTHRRSLQRNGQAGSWKRRAAGGGDGRLRRVHGGKGVRGRFRDTHRCESLRRHDGGPRRATDSKPPGASRHRSPPRDLVDSRTARTVEATSRSGGRTGAPSSSTGRQAPGKTRGRWRRRQAAAGTWRERCPRKIPRYSPLRKLATARRRASPRDGLAAWPATRSAMNRRGCLRMRRCAPGQDPPGLSFRGPATP
jgi:hypothetical protein